MAAESGLFDIIAHADLPKKFGFYPKQDCTPLFTRFLEAAKERDVAIELNTAGLRKDCKEIYPSPQIVRLACQMGVPITFASDAHAPDEVGMNFGEALELARTTGYHRSCRFRQRQREEVEL
jgi:histidinol-phosphatase (PHP family)